jgi:hypothetical protein
MLDVNLVVWPLALTSSIYKVNQTNHFFNLGYGWLCKHCSAANTEAREHKKASNHPQHLHVNESPEQHNLPLARWTNSSRQSLQCPTCGIEELVSKA